VLFLCLNLLLYIQNTTESVKGVLVAFFVLSVFVSDNKPIKFIQLKCLSISAACNVTDIAYTFCLFVPDVTERNEI